jgi:hypothetical protein
MKITSLFIKVAFFALCSITTTYLQSFSQTKIGTNLYLYGQLNDKLRDEKIMVECKKGSLDIQNALISELENQHCRVLSVGNVFMPGNNLNQAEKRQILDSLNVSYVFLIAMGNETTTGYHLTHTNANASAYDDGYNGVSAYGNATTVSGDVNFLTGLQLGISILSSKNNYEKPIAIFFGFAGANTKYSTENSVSKKIINRIIKYLKKEGAFKK